MSSVFTSAEVKNSGAVRLDIVAVKLETEVEYVFGFKCSYDGEVRIENNF